MKIAVTLNTAGLTIDSDAGVSGFSFTLGTANTVVLAGAGDVNVLGNANANSVTTSAGANAVAVAISAATMVGWWEDDAPVTVASVSAGCSAKATGPGAVLATAYVTFAKQVVVVVAHQVVGK